MSFSITPEGRLVYTMKITIDLIKSNPRYPKNPKNFGERLRKKRMDKRLTIKKLKSILALTEKDISI